MSSFLFPLLSGNGSVSFLIADLDVLFVRQDLNKKRKMIKELIDQFDQGGVIRKRKKEYNGDWHSISLQQFKFFSFS